MCDPSRACLKPSYAADLAASLYFTKLQNGARKGARIDMAAANMVQINVAGQLARCDIK